MLAVLLNNTPYNIPESINEVTIGRFIQFRHLDHDNPLEVLEWGIGASPVLTHNKQTENEVANCLTLIDNVANEIWRFMNSDERVRVPKTVNVLGLDIDLKADLLHSLPYWATVKCKELASAHTKGGVFDPTDAIPAVVGHYLYSLVTKHKYDEKRADEFANDVVMEMPMVEAIQLGNFFLLRQMRSWSNTTTYLANRLILWRKRLGLRYSKSTENLLP